VFVFEIAQIEALRQFDDLKAIASLGTIDFDTTLGNFYLNDRLYDGRVSTTMVVFLTPLGSYLLVQAMSSWRSHCTSMGLESVNSAHILALKIRRYLVSKKDELKPKTELQLLVPVVDEVKKEKRKKGIKFLKKTKKGDGSDSSDDEANKKVDPLDEVMKWLVEVTDKLEKDAYFHVISLQHCKEPLLLEHSIPQAVQVPARTELVQHAP
jgi:hypothetical protein